MNEPPSHLYSAAHFASDDVNMIAFGACHMTIFDPVIPFFQNGIAYKVWLSASKSSNISVPYILFLTLNWGYNDAMGHVVFNGSGHCPWLNSH